ncbi:MFS general substrate transporter [Flammula alnicola]|nr:MFS general substrate transporter [Flammula alnicola]
MADSDSLPKVEHEKDSDILVIEDISDAISALQSTVDEKKLLWKIDLHVVPWLSLLYLLSFMDRGSIGNAKLYGLEKDIGITDKQYLIGLTVFFFPYAFIEPISNVFLRRLQPSIYLSSMMLVWGLVMTCHGLITNYGGLITVRFLLGVTEGGLYAGVVFYISSWYKRSEMGTRIAIFFSGATVAGAFSGLLAAAISNMDGIGGKTGWQWIFILEGLATILVAIASFWIIQDFPTTAKFLTEKERTFVVHRLQQDTKLSANGKESFRMKYVLQSLTDWQTWIGCARFIYNRSDGPLYAFSLFTPSVINQVRFKATEANLLSVPVYAWACLVTCAVGVLADRVGARGYINCFFFGIGLVGYIILIVSRTPALSYFAVYLAASSVIHSSNSASWVACNVEGSYKRAVILATVIGFGNMNGVVTSNIYRARDTPWYRLGHGIVLAYIAIGFLSSLLYHILLKRENARRDRGERDEIIDGIDNKQAHERNGRYASVEEARIAKGDRWSGFRYTL